MPKPVKLNPEQRLRANMEREISIRLMREESKRQSDFLAVAKWDNALSTKDIEAKKKLMSKQMEQDKIVANRLTKEERRIKLENLYREDELKYEFMLSSMGMAYRRIRV
jgi:hypothetical protein